MPVARASVLLVLGALVLAAPAAEGAVTGRGTQFWAAWPRTHASLETSAAIIVMADQPTDVAIDGAFTASGVADVDAPWIVSVPPTLRTAMEGVPVDVGFRIRSVDGVSEISVLFRVPEQAEASDDIARILPVTELGNRYVVTSYTAGIPVAPSFLTVIATGDNTDVNVFSTCDAVAQQTVLNAGQVYQVFCNSLDNPPDITGSVVTSSRPVAVLAGVSTGWVPLNYLSGDFLIEAMVPSNRWGTEYYVAPLPKGPSPLDPFDVVRVTASGPLDVTIEDGIGAPQVFTMAGEGDFLEGTVRGPVRITGTSGIDVHLYATGYEASDIGDPFQSGVPDVESYHAYTRLYIPPDYTQGSFVTLITETAGTAAVRFAGQPVSNWTALPGGGYSWSTLDLGLVTGTHLVTGATPVGVIAYGFNDAYAPDPDLGRVPGSYGYPASEAEPFCRIETPAIAQAEACPGEPFTLMDPGSLVIGCVTVEYRWLENGVPIPGCGWSTGSDCQITYRGPAEYLFEARCADNPTDCAPGVTPVYLMDQPPVGLDILPDPAQICVGERIQIETVAGYGRYEWTSVPDDPGVTPQTTAVPRLLVSPEVDTTYSVQAIGGIGCLGTASRFVEVLADPIPPATGNTLLVARTAVPGELELTWADLPDPVSGYESAVHPCNGRPCAQPPDPARMEGLPPAAPSVGPGVQTLTIPTPSGPLAYIKLRALSPCAAVPGPACDGFPAQVPCP